MTVPWVLAKKRTTWAYFFSSSKSMYFFSMKKR
jgi:hypothetical protein